MKGHLIFKFSYKFCKIDPQEDLISIVGLQKSLLHFINSKVTVKCGFTIFLAKHFFYFCTANLNPTLKYCIPNGLLYPNWAIGPNQTNC